MNKAEEQQFVHNYSKLLVNVWTDPAVHAHLQSDPAYVLRHYGLVVPKDAKVHVVSNAGGGKSDLHAQIAAWDKGAQSGTYTLYVPAQPQLGKASADGERNTSTPCCCCCPC